MHWSIILTTGVIWNIKYIFLSKYFWHNYDGDDVCNCISFWLCRLTKTIPLTVTKTIPLTVSPTVMTPSYDTFDGPIPIVGKFDDFSAIIKGSFLRCSHRSKSFLWDSYSAPFTRPPHSPCVNVSHDGNNNFRSARVSLRSPGISTGFIFLFIDVYQMSLRYNT